MKLGFDLREEDLGGIFFSATSARGKMVLMALSLPFREHGRPERFKSAWKEMLIFELSTLALDRYSQEAWTSTDAHF